MRLANDQLLEEIGIHYSFNEQPGIHKTEYTLVHLPTGKRFPRHVWVFGNASALLLHWNQAPDWKIYVKEGRVPDGCCN